MNPALWAAKTGLDAQQTRLAVTSNNLANVSTSGFKKGRAVFEDLLYQNVRQVGGATSQDTMAPTGLSLGTGVRVVATEKNYSQGSLQQTGNNLDVAVNGRGETASVASAVPPPRPHRGPRCLLAATPILRRSGRRHGRSVRAT